MHRIIVLLGGLIVLFFWVMPAVAGPFTDVPTDHWAYEAIDKLQAEGFVEGYPDGTFRGNRAFTRYEMAMVVARIWDRIRSDLESYQASGMDTDAMNKMKDDLESELKIVYDLMDEFSEEIKNLGVRVDDLEKRMSSAEDRISNLEQFLDTIKISGALRTRIEDIITNEYGLQTRLGPVKFVPTPGMVAGESFRVEEMAMIGFDAHPSDYVDVYMTLLQAGDFLKMSKGADYMILDEAWADADMMKLMGWTPGDYISHFDLIVGRQYARFGEFGLAFDNGYESRPGIMIDAGGKSLELSAFLARSQYKDETDAGSIEGLAIGRVSYGFGVSRSTISPRECFARVGFNYLGTGVGSEQGMGVDLDTELLSASYLNRLRVEFFQLQQTQRGRDTSEKAWDDYRNSMIAWVDLFNDGNTRVSAAFADIGVVPGFSSVDNDPFEEYDRVEVQALNEDGIWPVFYGYESGVNPFPMDFEGFGMQAEHTWWDVLNTRLTFYDGTNQIDQDYPVLIKLNIRYPLSEASDIALEYIHSGIDAPTLAKLRGEFLVRF